MQELWRLLDLGELTGSWDAGIGSRIAEAVAAGQLASAGLADDYVDEIADAEGADPQRAGKGRPSAFAGLAADGRGLNSLMYLSVITTKESLGHGLAVDDAMVRGLQRALMLSTSEVAQAGRSAVGASMVGKRTIQGCVRVVNPPACARCIILAGKEYGWNRGFQRHPRLPLRLHPPADHADRPHPAPRLHRPPVVLQQPVPCRAGPHLHRRGRPGDPRGRRYRAGGERPARHVHHDRLRPHRAGHPRGHHPPRLLLPARAAPRDRPRPRLAVRPGLSG